MSFAIEPFKITQKEQMASDIFLFRLEKQGGTEKHGKGKKKAEQVHYEPGQFYQVSVAGIGEAPISVCSHATDFLEFNIRAVGNITDALVKLNKGDLMWIRGPYGTSYPMKEMAGKDLVIIGGGTGIAPLRGVVKYIEQHTADYGRIHLLFGFKSPDEVLFKRDMAVWNRIFDLRLTVDKAPPDYKGKIGLITKLVDESGLDGKRKIAIVCGPPVMIKFTIQSLEKLGFTHSQIYISHERRMKCGVGMCGHCMISGTYVCKDGPVFRYDRIKNLHE